MKNILILLFLAFTCSCTDTEETSKGADGSISLFNGKDLTGWKVSGFGGDGEIKVQDGEIFMDYGTPMTGLTYTGEVPTVDYEVELDAQKVDGNDFFVGLTFPYKDSHLTLILGGWGGVTCGISSFDYADASENDTAFVKLFHKKKWYHIKLRVIDEKVIVYIGDEKVIDREIQGQRVHTRPEVEPSKPFGLAAFETQAKYKNITLRKLPKSSTEE